jgi:hypothetical protein
MVSILIQFCEPHSPLKFICKSLLSTAHIFSKIKSLFFLSTRLHFHFVPIDLMEEEQGEQGGPGLGCEVRA